MARFSLQVTFATGRKLMLSETYGRQFEADRAACNYIRDFSDPCGTGEKVESVATLDSEIGAAMVGRKEPTDHWCNCGSDGCRVQS